MCELRVGDVDEGVFCVFFFLFSVLSFLFVSFLFLFFLLFFFQLHDLLVLRRWGRPPATAKVNSPGRGSTSKPLAEADHTITAQNPMKRLIWRQRRRRPTFCGRCKQTVNDVCFRLLQLAKQRALTCRED